MFDITVRDRAKIVFAGDSITQFGNFEEFFEETNIANRGIGSDTSEGLFMRIDQIIKLEPEKVFIMIGINDVSLGITSDDTEAYLKLTCEAIHRKLPNTSIYVMSILPAMTIDDDQRQIVKNLNQWYESYCRDNAGIQFVDLYTLYLDDLGAPNEKLYSKDGVHLNGAGYQVWINAVRDYVDK